MLHVHEVGAGHAVLLLHAFPLNGQMWQPQLDALGQHARLLAPDMPGFGQSPPPSDPPSVDGYAQAVLDVLEARRIDRIVICGLSMGGYIGFRLVPALGTRLRGLLLADTRATPDTPEAAAGRRAIAAQVEQEGAEVAIREFLPKLLGRTTLAGRPDVVERVIGIVRRNSPTGVADALRAMAVRPDSTPLLPRITCPTVCLAGDEDAITGPEVARAMAAAIPGARAVIVPGAGHLANLEQPEAFNATLRGLISAVAT